MKTLCRCSLALVLLPVLLVSHAVAQPGGVLINVTRSAAASASQDSLVNGYARSLSGQALQYHSSHPDADMALIVRANRAAPSVAWETDPLPASTAGDFYEFVWLAGISRFGFAQDKAVHKWAFLINGEPWFTFVNAKDDSAIRWSVQGREGSELRFESVNADTVGDLFGYMFLKVPRKSFTAGAPLRLAVDGENGESADWYMTFQHRFESAPRLRGEPVMVRSNLGARQMLRVSLDNLAPEATIEIVAPGQQPLRSALKIGGNVFPVSVPAVEAPTELPVTFQINGKVIANTTVALKPVTRRDIYLLSYSHNDIGYTDLQSDVEKKQWRNLEQGLALIEKTKDYPAEARFKWNMEVIWALDTYMKQATPAQRQRVITAARNGSLGLNGLYANILTGLANADEMRHFTDYARELSQRDGIHITSAVTSDIPGFTWGIVNALANSGIKYYSIAPNNGDRIGYVLEAWGDKPFYWQSQSGKEKVLAWVAGASYSTFHEGWLSKLGDEKMTKILRHLDDEQYPYDIVQLPYTHGDNGPPDETLPDFVKSWNERYVTPRLVIATHEQMFRDFEQRYGAKLPVVKGDFTPYWEDGAVSSALETAMNRLSADRLVLSETLWSMLSPKTYPASDFASAWRNVVLWDEHTWGAHNSTTEPDLPFVKNQWAAKQKFALNADQQSRELLNRALQLTGIETGARRAPDSRASGVGAVDIYNTSSWPRTDLVLLPKALSAAGDRVDNGWGKSLRSQRLSTGELAVLVENVPPFGSVRLSVRKGASNTTGKMQVRDHRAAHVRMSYSDINTIENDAVFVTASRETGAIASLRLKSTGTELVDRNKGLGLNQYEYVLGRDPAKAQTLANVKISVKEHGPLVSTLLVEGTAPGATKYSSEIRVVNGLDRVDITNTIDKLPVRDPEGVHIAFPFAVPGALARYDVADGIVRAEQDQMAGACRNFVSIQSWTDISNDNRGVTIAMVDAPLVEIGGINAEQGWMRSVPEPQSTVYSYVMNNYWHTNYKADQQGPVVFRYSLRPHAAFDPVATARFGQERKTPLLAVAADPSRQPVTPLLQIAPPNVIVSSAVPVDGAKAMLVRVYNPSPSAQQLSLKWRTGATLRESDAGARSGSVIDGAFTLPGYASTYVRVEPNAAQ